jgi:hypothetical protein
MLLPVTYAVILNIPSLEGDWGTALAAMGEHIPATIS